LRADGAASPRCGGTRAATRSRQRRGRHEPNAPGLARGKEQLEETLTKGQSPEQNSWKLTYHVFDYNLDFFEIGALDDDEWKLADGRTRYVERADADARANWLPAPPAPFRPILRMYEPHDAVFNGGYELPPIRRID
jgi:hypothetical protein